jgi:hypothetical protein
MVTLAQERQREQRAFRRLHKQLAKTHAGQWIGILEGEVVVTAGTLREALDQFREIEPDPERGLIFQAGEEWPRKKTILPLRW